MNNASVSVYANEIASKFERKDSEVAFVSKRRRPSSTEVVVTLAGLPSELVEVFYVDLHAVHGDRLGYLRFVRSGTVRDAYGLPVGRVQADYCLQSILPPESGCPAPLRLLPTYFLAYMPSPNFTEEDIIREP